MHKNPAPFVLLVFLPLAAPAQLHACANFLNVLNCAVVIFHHSVVNVNLSVVNVNHSVVGVNHSFASVNYSFDSVRHYVVSLNRSAVSVHPFFVDMHRSPATVMFYGSDMSDYWTA